LVFADFVLEVVFFATLKRSVVGRTLKGAAHFSLSSKLREYQKPHGFRLTNLFALVLARLVFAPHQNPHRRHYSNNA
jgi:hypothetical protein